MLPVLDWVIKFFPVSKLPLTSPVPVFITIFEPSQFLNFTLPVVLSMESLSAAMTSFKEITPVFPFDIRLLHCTLVKFALPVDVFMVILPLQLISERVTFPVETESSRFPVWRLSRQISPVLVLILRVLEAEAENSTSPVLKEISTSLNRKVSGIFISPVLSQIESVLYSDLGR